MKKEKSTKKKTKTDKEEFAEHIKQLESPNYQGGSWHLPENATPLEKSKYEVCREILVYQRKNKISDEKLAKQMELTLAETEDVLYYRIARFTLDRLLTYANKLFKLEPLMLGIVKKSKERETIRKH
jgi:predicted XRE-type DNA-binding protein